LYTILCHVAQFAEVIEVAAMSPSAAKQKKLRLASLSPSQIRVSDTTLLLWVKTLGGARFDVTRFLFNR
jgi:hypothetical protein